jgi:sugar phosphate isomerase/epimerase
MNSLTTITRPLAITMWDFSWLERRWPGAGYENWDEALDGLVERGYDAVRIDAYPHLLASDPPRNWHILPPWNTQDWGAPAPVSVQVWPALPEFIRKCAARGIKVALSTWFQNDTTQQRLAIASPAAHARIWRQTLELLEREGLLDTLLYVDLCNEWPLTPWAPFFPQSPAADWRTPSSLQWMRNSIAALRARFPSLAFTYSLCNHFEHEASYQVDLSHLDFLEIHLWMSSWTDFYERVDYHFERFDGKGYANVAARAAALYRADPDYWKSAFAPCIDRLAAWSAAANQPLITTEGWSLVDYKDGPNLPWDWILEYNAWAIERVSATGRWAAVCTSNFCGPQFRGMWREVAWHQRLTKIIKAGQLPVRATPASISSAK